MLRKHILSKVNENYNIKVEKNTIKGKTTFETNTIEVSDADEFILGSRTEETRTIEISDTDETIGTTKITKILEATDADEFINVMVENNKFNLKLNGPTKLTETIEVSDPDEVLS